MRKATIALVAVLFSLLCYSQDNNTLARIAYEDAETALSNGNCSKAIEELNNVDKYLGKITPKAQYLKVQAWSLAASQNAVNIDGAITTCRNYLALSTSFELPEDKVMEVTRLKLKLEQDKVANEAKLKAANEDQQMAQKESDLLSALTTALSQFSLKYSGYDFYKGITFSAMQAARPEIDAVLKKGDTRSWECNQTFHYYANAKKWKGGPDNFTTINTDRGNIVNNISDYLFYDTKKFKEKSIQENIAECQSEFRKITQLISNLGIKTYYSDATNKYYTYGRIALQVNDGQDGFSIEVTNGRDMGPYPCLKTMLGLRVAFTAEGNNYFPVRYTNGSLSQCNSCTPW